MNNKKEQMEHYGPVELDWGVYPEGLQNDAGGFWGEECIAPKVLAEDAERAAYYKRNMEQRGGNNAYLYEVNPRRLRYAYGAGCMNPNCHCHKCQGPCFCEPRQKKIFADPSLYYYQNTMNWRKIFIFVLAILIVAFFYKKMM